MPEILTVLNNAIAVVKKLREISQKIKDVEVNNLIADLNLALADLKMQVAELQEENLSLKKDIDKLKEAADFRQSITLRDGVYYLTIPVTGRPEGPYCTSCFDTKSQLVLLSQLSGDFRVFGQYVCPSCHANYGQAIM